MLPKTYIFCLFLVMVSRVSAQEEDAEPAGRTPQTCIKYTTSFFMDTANTILKCTGQKFRPNNLIEYGTRAHCIFKCVLGEFGMLNSEGKWDEVSAAFFLEESFAPSVQATLLPKAQACFPLAENFDNSDYWCKSYGPFFKCIQKALRKSIVPYLTWCGIGPILGIALDTFKHLSPDTIPDEGEGEEDFRREFSLAQNPMNKTLKCLDLQCNRQYLIQRHNNSAKVDIVVYDRNMTELSRTTKISRYPQLNNPSVFFPYSAENPFMNIFKSLNNTLKTMENKITVNY